MRPLFGSYFQNFDIWKGYNFIVTDTKIKRIIELAFAMAIFTAHGSDRNEDLSKMVRCLALTDPATSERELPEGFSGPVIIKDGGEQFSLVFEKNDIVVINQKGSKVLKRSLKARPGLRQKVLESVIGAMRFNSEHPSKKPLAINISLAKSTCGEVSNSEFRMFSEKYLHAYRSNGNRFYESDFHK